MCSRRTQTKKLLLIPAYNAGVVLAALIFVGLQLPEVASAQTSMDVALVKNSCSATSGVRVAVFENGAVQVNGNAVAIGEHNAALNLASRSAREICIYREHPEADEPHPIMYKVLDILVGLKLPIAFYWDATFETQVQFHPSE